MEHLTATKTAPATRPCAATASAIKAPRFPITGTNEPLDAAIAAVQALFDAYPAIADAHTAAEDALGPNANTAQIKAEERAENRMLAALDRIERALKAIQKIKATSIAEAQVKQHAGALGLALLATPFSKWRAFSADQAIMAVGASNSDYREELAGLTATFARDIASVTPPPSAGALTFGAHKDGGVCADLLWEADRLWEADEDERWKEVNRAFLDAPILTISDATAKLLWLFRGCRAGATGNEPKVIGQLAAALGADPAAVLTDPFSEEPTQDWVVKPADEEKALDFRAHGAAEPSPDFDAAAWVDAFEHIPGHSVSGSGPAYMEPDAWPAGDMTTSPMGQALWTALSTEQKAAVRREGARRRPLIPPGTDFSKMVFRPLSRNENEVLIAAE